MINLAKFHARFWCGHDPSILYRNFPDLENIRSVTSKETGFTIKYMVETGGWKSMMAMPEYAQVRVQCLRVFQ